MLRISVVSIVLFIAVSRGFHIQPRVINGDLSDDRQFPFYVALKADSGQCGGTLISNRWVLTAAHCLARDVDINIYVGITAEGKFERKVIVPLSNQHIYPEYNASGMAHDIALLKLAVPIKFNQYIQPVVLTNVCEVPHKGSEPIIVAGRGRTVMDKKAFDPRLRHAYFITMPSDRCSEQLVPKRGPNMIICANANYDNNQTMYFGDSGGPLLRRYDGHLLGVASSVQHVGKRGNPVRFQVFTNVAYYYSWIERMSGFKLPPRNCVQASGYQ